MAVTVRASSQVLESLTGTEPAGAADGDLLIALVTSPDSVTVHVPPAGWVQIAQRANGSSANKRASVWSRPRNGAPALTWTGPVTTGASVFIAALKGAGAVDGVTSSTTALSDATPGANSFTADYDGSMLLAMLATTWPTITTATPAGMNAEQSANAYGALASLGVNAGPTGTKSFGTSGGTDRHITFSVVILPAAAPTMPITRTPNNRVGPPVLRARWRPAPITAPNVAPAPPPIPSDTNPGVLPARTPNPMVGPPALRARWRPTPIPDRTLAPATNTNPGVLPTLAPVALRVGPPAKWVRSRPGRIWDNTAAPPPIPPEPSDTNPGVLPARTPNPMVGPWALRQAWRPAPIPFPDLAPLTDTNPGVLPARMPNARVGPPVLRQGWRLTPIPFPDLAPLTDTNPGVIPNRVPNAFVGPPVLRRIRWAPIIDPTLAPPPPVPTDTEFGPVRTRMPNPRVGPPVLRQRSQIYFPLVEVHPPPPPPPEFFARLRAKAMLEALQRGTGSLNALSGGRATLARPTKGIGSSATLPAGSASQELPEAGKSRIPPPGE